MSRPARTAARATLALAAALGLTACSDPMGPGSRDERAVSAAVPAEAAPQFGRRFASRNAPASPRFGRRVGSAAPSAPAAPSFGRRYN